MEQLKNILLDNVSDQFMKFIFLTNDGSDKKKINDIDIIVVIDDNCSKFFTIKKFAPIAVEWSEKLSILVTFFPISKSEFDSESNMFIKNLKKFGKSINH